MYNFDLYEFNSDMEAVRIIGLHSNCIPREGERIKLLDIIYLVEKIRYEYKATGDLIHISVFVRKLFKKKKVK
jgi:hypothetical protein